MNCFYHQTSVAVGTCKSCGKGLCPTCATDLGKGLACANRCEPDVLASIELMDRVVKRAPINEHLITTARSNRYLGATFQVVFGAIFLALALYKFTQGGVDEPVIFFGAMGLSFLVYGLIMLWKTGGFPGR
jgi:hypothetical protein